MSAKVPAANESASTPRDENTAELEHSMQTAPYANDSDKPSPKSATPHKASHLHYFHKLIREDPVHRPYRIAAIVATGVALLTSIGSVITAGVMWEHAYSYTGTDTDRVLYAALYIFVLVESCLSFVAMLVDFSELFFRPEHVLIRDRTDSKFVGRCITVLLLVLGAVYSFVVPIVLKDHKPKVSPALCVIPGVRFIALIIFFVVLIIDSKL